MNKLILILSVFLSCTCKAQLKIGDTGNISLGGILPRSDYKLVVKGDLMLTNHPIISPPLTRSTELRIKLGNGAPGVDIGTPTDGIAFYSSETGYNKIYAERVNTTSDLKLKTNIKLLEQDNGLIFQLKPKVYNRYTNEFRNAIGSKVEFGFIAQDIAAVFPNMVDTVHNTLLLDYNQFIPLLVGEAQNQKRQLDSLRHQVKELSTLLMECCQESNNAKNYTYKPVANSGFFKEDISGGDNQNTLSQNTPNPFSDETEIKYYISQPFSKASLKLFNLQGALTKSYPINNIGAGSILIGKDSKLVPGIYLYSLVIDGVEIHTKRMIFE